ncbi:hypothetical protein LTR84_011298 [Exophiala bonariae]|uniref:Reticulon domain-containing protein n=1 Tax=Exophiala bonariae TaxID=1690606 RepID=A0AAV9MSN8_9EURO|nr:hypothetical protein LTR84_011298 [Exophiala bonariae]
MRVASAGFPVRKLQHVHDLIQWAVVHAQKILYGQDLEKTFVAFLAFTALYWLLPIISLFWLTVVALTLSFLATLATTPRGRAAARDAQVSAQELANVAVENGKELAQNGKDKANELSSVTRNAAVHTKGHVQDLAQSGKQATANGAAQVRVNASNISVATTENVREFAQQAIAKASDLSSQAQKTAVDTKERVRDMAQNGKQSVANGSVHVSDIASNISTSVTENVRNMSDIGPHSMDKAQDGATSAGDDEKDHINRPLYSEINSNSGEDHSITGHATNEASHLSNRAAETPKHVGPGGFYDQTNSGNYSQGSSINDTDVSASQTAPNHAAKRRTSTYMEPTPLSAELIGTENTGSAADTTSIYADEGDVDGSHGIMNRPRGL